MGWYFWDSLNNFPNNLSSNCFSIIWCSLPESIVGRWKELQNGDWSNRTIFFYICYPELLILYKKELYLHSPPSPSSFFSFWYHYWWAHGFKIFLYSPLPSFLFDTSVVPSLASRFPFKQAPMFFWYDPVSLCSFYPAQDIPD